ncbi:hypothetical protein NMY22_g15722 [Coprinellus aureogranulatus]|nr:hypothetical protein NMY22_g15722 [Coprinellus aureogranulatus]
MYGRFSFIHGTFWVDVVAVKYWSLERGGLVRRGEEEEGVMDDGIRRGSGVEGEGREEEEKGGRQRESVTKKKGEKDVQNPTHRIQDHLQHRLGSETRPDNIRYRLHAVHHGVVGRIARSWCRRRAKGVGDRGRAERRRGKVSNERQQWKDRKTNLRSSDVRDLRLPPCLALRPSICTTPSSALILLTAPSLPIQQE